MTQITYMFVNASKRIIENKNFNYRSISVIDFEKAEYKSIYGELMKTPYYIWEAITKKQKGTELKNMRIGLFSTPHDIQEKDFNTLLDLIFGSWKFYFLPEEIKQEALFTPAKGLTNFWELPKPKDLSILPTSKLTKTNCSRISNGILILKNLKNKRLKIALHRFSASYKRTDPLDAVLDCCSCLEALYNLSDELRMKIALISYHLVNTEKKKALERVYEMYGKRNDFIHGNKIPEISHIEAEEYISQTAIILMSIFDLGQLPNTEQLNKKIFDYYA